MFEVVTDSKKVVTDDLVLKRLAEQGIDKDYVEFCQDYAPRSLGKEYSPYAKFYRDLKSNKRVMVVSGLPKVNADGVKIGGNAHNQPKVGWELKAGKYVTKPNIFSGIVKGLRVELTNLNDQPTGTKKGDTVSWQPQLHLNNVEVLPIAKKATLLETDPINQFYHHNVLEWDYGICKRRIRIIEGRLRERWIFIQDPQGEVRIKHNKQGAIRLKLGQYKINNDEELIPASVFAKAEYPLEIKASPETFYPDDHVEVSSVDGKVVRTSTTDTWAQLRGGAGTSSDDDNDNQYVSSIFWSQTAWGGITRGVMLFDTSGLPDTATVTGATLSLYGVAKADGLSITPGSNIYSSNPISNTALENGDFVYTRFGTAAFCDTTITYANWKVADPFWNDFAFNQDGMDAISKIGVSKFGTWNVANDLGNAEPPNGFGDWANSYIDCYWSDKGTGFKPKLVVTYTVAGEDYKKIIDETESLAEAIKIARGLPAKVISETMNITEAFVRLVIRCINETVNITEGLARLKNIFKVIGETEAISEALARLKCIRHSIAETVNITEALARLKVIVRCIGETVSISEALIKARTLIKILNETMGISEHIRHYMWWILDIFSKLKSALKITSNIEER